MPAGLHDGAIIVDTGLNNAGFNRDARQYKAAANSLKNAVNRIFQSMGKSGEKYTQALANQVKAERELNKQIDKTREKYADVVREMNELQKTGGSKSRYDELSEQAKGLAAKLSELRQAKQNLGGVSASFDRVAESAGKARRNIVGIVAGGAWSYLKKVAAGAKNAAVQLAKIASRAVTSGMKKLAAYALGAARGLFGLGKGARDSGRGFQFSLKNLLKYGLGIRSLFVLFNRLRSAIKEGFGALKEYDPRVRASLASLSAALNSLKGASAAAFAPILNAIAPALTTLINLVTQATNALGMFFAALTGQSYYSVAKGVASIGKAASGSSGSVKELKRQLAGFDELNILSAGSSGGSGGGGGGASSGISYEQTPIAAGIKNFVEQIKALVAEENWNGLGGMIAEKINGALDKARALISWRNIGGKITEVMQGITGTINGLVAGIDWPNVGATLAEGLNTVVNTALLWYRGIDWAKLGRSLAEALNGLIRRIDWEKIGDLIQSKLKALFDLTKNFVITFDEIAAARAIRTALGRIDWPTLARDFWETAKTAFRKAGNFLKVLMGGDVYDVAGDAVDQMWERGSGSASSQTYATSWVRVFAKKIGELLASIPWSKIFEGAKKTIGDAITGLIDGLFGTKEGVFLAKLTGAIVGLKIAIPFLIKGLAGKLVSSIGVLAKGVVSELEKMGESIWTTVKAWFSGGGSTPTVDIGGFLDTAGLSSGMAVGLELFRMKNAADKELEEITKTMDGPVGKIMKVASWFNYFAERGPNGDYTLRIDPDEMNDLTKALGENADATKHNRNQWAANGGDLASWDAEFNKNTDAVEQNTKELKKQTVAARRGQNRYSEGAGAAVSPREVKIAWNPIGIKGATLGKDFDLRSAFMAQLSDGLSVDAKVNFLPAGATNYVNNLGGYLKAMFAPGTDTVARVSLIKKAWETVASWVGLSAGGTVNKAVGLIKDAWTTISAWAEASKGSTVINQAVGLIKNAWTTISAWANNNKGTTAVTQAVGLTKNWAGSTVADWFRYAGYLAGTASQAISAVKGWTGDKIANWMSWANYLSGTASQPITPTKNWSGDKIANWMSLAGYLSGAASQGINLARSWPGNGNVARWIETAGYLSGMVAQDVALDKGWGTSTVGQWVSSFVQGFVAQAVGLDRGWGNKTVTSWVDSQVVGQVIQTVSLVVDTVKTVSGVLLNFANKAAGGIITAGGQMLNFAAGGIIRGGMASCWNSIPKYAAGTAAAHGTLFVAGEAGPEIVGHVGGRTEVLNKSQLAQTMYSAVTSGMISALRGITFTMPAMATGGIMPYEVSAQIARSASDIQDTLDANHEDLIQTIISLAGQIVAAVQRLESRGAAAGAGGMNAQQIIDEINRRTQMFAASPLRGV